jgi:hypothetical protein
MPKSFNRAHASRAIPPVALGIELKLFDFATCMVEDILTRCPGCGALEPLISVPSQAVASLNSAHLGG